MVPPAHARPGVCWYQDMLDIVHSTRGRRFQERYRRKSVGDINAPYRVSRPPWVQRGQQARQGIHESAESHLTETPDRCRLERTGLTAEGPRDGRSDVDRSNTVGVHRHGRCPPVSRSTHVRVAGKTHGQALWRSGARHSPWRTGIVNVKVEPTPTWLFTQI